MVACWAQSVNNGHPVTINGRGSLAQVHEKKKKSEICFTDRVEKSTKFSLHHFSTRLGQLGANISPDRSSLTPQVLIGNFLFNPFVVCHKYWEKLYELQHINLLSLYLPKEDGVSPDVEYITQQIIFSIFLQ